MKRLLMAVVIAASCCVSTMARSAALQDNRPLAARAFVPASQGQDTQRADEGRDEQRRSEEDVARPGQGRETDRPGDLPLRQPGAPPADTLRLQFDEARIDGSLVDARNVSMTVGEYELVGDHLTGDLEAELVCTGNPSLTYRGQVLYGDTIRFHVKTKAYSIENLRTALTPEFLQNRTLGEVYLRGDAVQGRDRDPIIGRDAVGTTCDRPTPHYEIEARAIEVQPGKRLILRKAGIVYRNRKLLVLPTLIIPLDRRLSRPGYDATVGRSQEEGWFVKTTHSYELSGRAPGLYRVDLMERKGVGLGFEQLWEQTRARAFASLYGTPGGRDGSNLSGRARLQLDLSAGQRLNVDYDTRRNDYRGLPDSTEDSWRFNYNLSTPALTLQTGYARRSSTSGAYTSTSETLNLSQQFTLSRVLSAGLNADYSRYRSGSSGTGGSLFQTNEQLATRLQSTYRGPNYVLQLSANRNVPVGKSTGYSYFSGVERLPEISLSQFRFVRGPLASLPITLNLAAGKFSEGATGTTPRMVTERASFGLDYTGRRGGPGSSSTLDVSASFLQHVYGEGSAQYILRANSSYIQRWGSRSGFSIRHNYQHPHGGTPFRFDQQGKFHDITGDVGFLNDDRFQLTARVGYDLARSNLWGARGPWQTTAVNLYLRPVSWAALRTLAAYDLNTGEMQSVTADLRLRGQRDFALDLVGRYDPRRHKFGQVNVYANLPVLPAWRVLVLTQYNGYLNRFESRNLQVIHDMHCLEASLTFIDNPYGWRADRQVIFQLRIKAFPSFQQFGTGMYGQAIDTSVGERF